ncbi:doublecortin domain-containing protein 2B isoform X2 [Brachyhypopomus gauderio]|uniref:doublecortin domain-containing protein 2B isoform X2 n=1 Tax=Brachyhypopomus gauderio TaxID=698409 RepID=UPI004041ADBA
MRVSSGLAQSWSCQGKLQQEPNPVYIPQYKLTSTGLKRGAKVPSRPNVSAKWRKVITLPCIIYVFRNGDVLSAAMRFIIPRNMQKNLEQILSLVSEKAMLRTGAVRRLCTLDGITVMTAEELENGRCYVAVGTERFKKLPYVELLLNKGTGGSADRHYPGERGLHRRTETKKGFPQDSHSDSALLESPERDGRRVKSTGDETVGGALAQTAGNEREEISVFHAKPVRVRKHRGTRRTPARIGAAQPSVFKGAGRRREEVRGAEEVAEDESTAVELPVDQRVAEIVEDEEVNKSQSDHTYQTQVSEERLTSRRSREADVDDLRSLDGETPAHGSSSPAGHTRAQEDVFTEDLQESSQDDHVSQNGGSHGAQTM